MIDQASQYQEQQTDADPELWGVKDTRNLDTHGGGWVNEKGELITMASTNLKSEMKWLRMTQRDAHDLAMELNG